MFFQKINDHFTPRNLPQRECFLTLLTFTGFNRSIVAVEGDRVEMSCFASGYPTPQIFWRRMDNDILPTNNSIHVWLRPDSDEMKRA